MAIKNENKFILSNSIETKTKKLKEVEAIRKSNNHGKITVQAMSKVLNNEEQFKHATVSHDFKIALQKGRTAAGMKQEELGKKINEKTSVIQEYESGKAIPNNKIISKLEKALGCKLPRSKNIQ